MSAGRYTFEVGEQAWTLADSHGPISARRRHDGANHYCIDGHWWTETELERKPAPACRPLLDEADIELLVVACGRMARALYHDPASSPQFTWQQAVSLQTRIGANQRALTVIAAGIAPAASMAEIPTSGTE